ncbi:hypothetical protein [Actinomadura flavalba]|uniref:hypothetical protein n=1 Tax=Actinomadura flavalba TaxID=1120938 RepID=UPI0003660EA8|nr:hypothetical protein [Actinomadura flavalba]
MRDELVLKPDAGTQAVVAGVLALAGAGLVAAVVLGPAPTVLAWVVGGVFGPAVVLACAAVRTRIVVTDDAIVRQGVFGRRTWERGRAVRTVRAHLASTVEAEGQGDTVFVLDARGRVLFRVAALHYTRDGLDRLVAALGVPCDAVEGPVSAKEFDRTHPGLVSWVEKHPYRLIAVVAGVLGAVALAVAGAVLALGA